MDFCLQIRLGRFVEVGGINIREQNIGINFLEHLRTFNNTTRDAEHNGNESAPAALERWPPTKLARIPTSDARFIERRVTMNAAFESFGDARGIFGHVSREIRIQKRV